MKKENPKIVKTADSQYALFKKADSKKNIRDVLWSLDIRLV